MEITPSVSYIFQIILAIIAVISIWNNKK